jgi:hypothetical protein
MRYAILLIGLFVCNAVSTDAFVKVDYKCVADCTAKGFTYSYCYSSCLYDDNQHQQQQLVSEQKKHQKSQKSPIDYKCLNDCKARGYMDQFCKQQCSYWCLFNRFSYRPDDDLIQRNNAISSRILQNLAEILSDYIHRNQPEWNDASRQVSERLGRCRREEVPLQPLRLP